MATHNTNDNVVFIDTNLDTHLAFTVSDRDTVSDLKKSILSEHPLCFPKIGDIQIHGIKVKRRGCFYHLPDSMFVRSACSGSNKGWFLSVDVSVLGECARNEQLLSNGSPNRVACLGTANNALIGHGDNAISLPFKRVPSFDNFKLPQLENKLVENEEISGASPCVSEHTGKVAVKNLDASGGNDTGIPLPDSTPETEDRCFVNQELLPSSNIECEVDGSGKGIEDGHNVCEENPLISVPIAKKKQKSKSKKEEVVQGDNSEDAIASVGNPLRFKSKGASCVTNRLPDSHIECEVDGIVREEENCKSVSNVKKKQKSKRKKEDSVGEDRVLDDTSKVNEVSAVVKKKHKSKREKEDTVPDYTSKVNDISVVGSSDYAIQQDIEVVANPSENADKEVIMETEVLKEHQHTDCNNNNAKNDLDAAVLVYEVLEPGPVTNKKHKKRKRSLPDDSKEMFNVETASQKDDAQKSDEAPKERIESKDQFELENKKSGDDVEDKHDKVTEDILDTEPPAKKKKRSKEKNREKSLPGAKLINDFNVDNASRDILEDQQKVRNNNADQSAEHFSETDSLRSSVRGGRRKGKINSSNPPETSVLTSSRKDEEADHSSIRRGIQEEISEDGLFSKDISMSKAAIDNLETGTNACKEGIQSTEKITRHYKNHSDIEVQAHISDVDEPIELTKDNENVVLDQCHENEAGQIEGAEQGREVSPQNDPNLMLLEKSTPSNQENTDANIGELKVTSKVVDINGVTEPIKSEKKKRGMRKVTNSDGGSALREAIGELNVTSKVVDNTDSNIGELNVTSKVVDVNGVTEPIKSEKKKRGMRKVTNSDGGSALREAIGELNVTSKVVDNTDSNIGEFNVTSKVVDVNGVTEPIKSEKKKRGMRKVTNSDGGSALREAIGELNVKTSKVVDVNGMTEPIKSEKKKRGIRKATNSAGGSALTEGTGLVDASKSETAIMKSHTATKSDPMSGNRETEKNPLNQTEGEKMQQEKILGTSDKEDVFNADNAGSSKQIETKSNAEHMDKGQRKKSNNKQASNSKSTSSVLLEKQNKAGKASRNNIRGVVSKTQQKKNLLAGAIFKDDSSSTSEDEVDNSDASTTTPSDSPLLSDFSDGDGSSGSYGGRSPGNDGRSSLKGSFSGTKKMRIDQILRSSRRFQKVRTMASQLEESESQQEFVPDSLAE